MRKTIHYRSKAKPPVVLHDHPVPVPPNPDPESMVRTQIYLTREEHGFLSAESSRRGEPMAAILRSYIDEKMRLPESAWVDNPMLAPTPKDNSLSLPEDAAINHDHYLYGTPRKYVKRRGGWVLSNSRSNAAP